MTFNCHDLQLGLPPPPSYACSWVSTPGQDWLYPLSGQGSTPFLRQNRRAAPLPQQTGYATSGMPLVVTREDFLVFIFWSFKCLKSSQKCNNAFFFTVRSTKDTDHLK